jgi:hypothetical protein
MPLPTTATLAYKATPTNAAPAALQAAMFAVVLYDGIGLNDPVLKDLFDSTVMSDTTDLTVTRTIVLSLGPGFFTLFPTAASWQAAFNDLYGRTLELALSTPVKSLVPIFA